MSDQERKLEDAALCLFAWDLHDEGIDPVLQFAADAGLTSLFLVGVYHAGWFLLPHSPKRKCHLTEDGVAYFHPTSAPYDATPLRPKVAHIAEETDWFAEVGRRLDSFGLLLTAWTVCTHNTRLGLEHPEHTIRNAFGDSYPHALCPASPAVRRYIRSLCADLASQYPLQSIFLEAPDYRGRRHGHHHERDLAPLGPLENDLLDVSFSSHDQARATLAGIDAEALQQAIRDHLEACLADAPRRPAGLPETMDQFLSTHPELTDYQTVLDEQVASLIAEIKGDLRESGVVLEGVEPSHVYDTILVGAYGKGPDEVAHMTRQAHERSQSRQRIRVGFRLGAGPTGKLEGIANLEQARACVQAATDHGADAVFFYNYSESPRTCLSWIEPAIAGIVTPTAQKESPER
ncbi:MAG: hypothetical protein JXQ73_31885 [Phycisphaerae bacterium]|nr:hypothetical protein [Phycisphaerae bacterium]